MKEMHKIGILGFGRFSPMFIKLKKKAVSKERVDEELKTATKLTSEKRRRSRNVFSESNPVKNKNSSSGNGSKDGGRKMSSRFRSDDQMTVASKCKKGKKKGKKVKRNACASEAYRTLHSRTSPRPLYNAIQNMNKAQQDCVRGMGFDKILYFNVDGIPTKMAYYVVDVFDPDKMELKLENNIIRITVELIHEILGVPNSGETLESLKESDEVDDITSEWCKKYEGKLTANAVMEHMASTRSACFHFQVDFIMLFCNTMIKCNKSGKCYTRLLKYINESTNFKDINWCEYIYRKLKTCKEKWNRDDEKCAFTGPLTLLTLAYLRGTACEKMEIGKSQLAIQVWTMAKIKLREDYEIKSGGFGRGELIEMEDPNQQPTVEDYKVMLNKLCEKIEFSRGIFIDIVTEAKTVYPDYQLWSDLENKMRSLFTAVITNQEDTQLGGEEAELHTPGPMDYQQSLEDIKSVSADDMNQHGVRNENSEITPSFDVWDDPETLNEIELTLQKIERERLLKTNENVQMEPSFSLGLTQLFDDVANCSNENKAALSGDENDMDNLDHVILSDRMDKLKREASAKRSRALTKPAILKSPYVNRVVDINRGPSKDEQKVWKYLFCPIVDSPECAFSTKEGYAVDRLDFESFAPRAWVEANIIDCWSKLLNHEETARSKDSPRRLFLTTYIITPGMLGEGETTGESKLALFRENLLHILNCQQHLMTLSRFDLVFFPVIDKHHYYLICFDIKNPSMTIIDNISNNAQSVTRKEEGLTTRGDGIEGVALQYKSIFGEYLELVAHPKSNQIQHVEPIRLRLEWSTHKNNSDCGIFLMRHMESYKGQNQQRWDCGFAEEGRKQTFQIRRLRYKYAAKILLSDINVQRDVVLRDADLISKELERKKNENKEKKRQKKGSVERISNKKRKN